MSGPRLLDGNETNYWSTTLINKKETRRKKRRKEKPRSQGVLSVETSPDAGVLELLSLYSNVFFCCWRWRITLHVSASNQYRQTSNSRSIVSIQNRFFVSRRSLPWLCLALVTLPRFASALLLEMRGKKKRTGFYYIGIIRSSGKWKMKPTTRIGWLCLCWAWIRCWQLLASCGYQNINQRKGWKESILCFYSLDYS